MQYSRTMAVYCLLEVFLLISVLALAEGACENCATCVGDTMCSSCNHGYYLSNGICTLCQGNCQNCDIEGRCIQCLVGFYIVSNTGSCLACSTGCESCDSNEVCRICEDRYFLENDKCQTCSNTCSTCLSSTYCKMCDQGYWGSDNCLNICPDKCTNNKCDIHGFCLECPDGKYGKECLYSCPENCLNKTCSIDGNSCIYGCIPGFNGSTCETICPDNCNSKKCSKFGECTTGCKPGLSGNYCDQKCPNTCPNNECFQINGSCVSTCPETCHTCKSLTSCTSCKQGHYGTICENQCPDSNCKECNQGTGTCLKCNNGHFLSSASCIPCAIECATCEGQTSSNCLSCAKGYYLENNQCKSCIDGCSGCSWYDYCYECQAGYFLGTSECIHCPTNCKTCISTNNCTSCIDKYQGNTCDRFVCAGQKYSDSIGTDLCECDQQKCSNQSGDSCLACTDVGWYPSGPGCCPCADGTYENNGTCVTCPKHCIPQDQCNVSTGACIVGCEDRWWGSKCDQRCNDTCRSCLRNGTCDQSSAGGDPDPATTPAALPAKDGSNTVIIAAAGGSGAVLLIIIVFVVIICVVRRKSSKKTSEQKQNGSATLQNGGFVDNGNNDSEDEYTMNAMYVPLTETQLGAKGYTPSVQYDNRFSLDDERNTTDVDTGHYSFVDKSGNKAETTLDLHVNQYENYRGLVDADSSTNEVSETGHYSYVDKSRKAGEQGKEAVYSVPKKPRKVES